MKCIYKNIIEEEEFNSSMLKIGEMMLCLDPYYRNHILLRTFDRFVSLTNPSSTWNTCTKLIGKKLLPGEEVTLIQE